MKTNTKIGMSLVAAGIAGGIGWWGFSRSLPSPQGSTPKAQSLLDSVLESPEILDSAAGQARRPRYEAAETTVAPRPQLLSEVERSGIARAKREPVAAESLYFWNDFASLRKAEIRDPDSEENRAGVVSLMKARQGRLGQK